MPVYFQSNRGTGGRRIVIALILAAIALFSYYSNSDYNDITGETQQIALSPEQEIALGLSSAPQMAAEFGGVSIDRQATARVSSIGEMLVTKSAARQIKWAYQFYLLADTKTINAFALPGGQVFITEGLYRLLKNDNELAGVLAHEIGHVIARHGAEHLAKQQLTQGLTSAAMIGTGSYDAGQMAALVGQFISLRYSRSDELESDALGVRFMAEAGFDPEALIEVMNVLERASHARNHNDFFSTHPNPENRRERIREAIRQLPN